MKTFHYANIDKSDRLTKVYDFIKRMGKHGATGLDIWNGAGVLNPGTVVSEINANLWNIEPDARIVCEYRGRTPTGAKIYRYFYRRFPQA